jgi:aspartate-semialdehyde dehydrogenase
MFVCILGATGLVGRETLRLVARAWPTATVALYASRDQELELDGTRWDVKAASRLEAADAPRGDLAFVALDDAHSERYVPRLLDLGYRVVDKSNTYRTDPQVVLGVGGVNDDLVTDAVRLVANPNCTTIPMTLALAPLQRAFGLRSVTVSTYQAISGAGQATLDEFLATSAAGYAEPDRLGLRFDARGYAGNTVPHAGKTDETGFSAEERKLVFESGKILRQPELAVGAQCCRVPVAVGHYENAWVQFRDPVTVAAAEEILGKEARAPFVRLFRGSAGEGLSALAAVHERDLALVGRLRADVRDPSRTLCMTIVADNLRLGAATNAVRIASRWFASADPALQAPG